MVNGTNGTNGKFCFGEFEFEDFLSHQNGILLEVLKVKLEEKKGNLTPADIHDVYKECWVRIQKDLEQWCLLRNSGDRSVNVNLSKCCRTQIDQDARDQQLDAIELAYNMRSYLVCRLYDQPADKRLEIIADLKTVFKRKSQVESTSGAASTFPGLFPELFQDMNAIDELMPGDFFHLKPALQRFLREVGPRIVLKTKKYYQNSQLGDSECQFCNSRWVKWVKEPSGSEMTNFSELSCFTFPEQLESYLVLRFRRTFFEELVDFLDRYFSAHRFEN